MYGPGSGGGQGGGGGGDYRDGGKGGGGGGDYRDGGKGGGGRGGGRERMMTVSATTAASMSRLCCYCSIYTVLYMCI
jgi:hypothetical protein